MGWGRRWGGQSHPSPAWELGGSVPSTAALQKKKALGLSVEEQDEVPASVCSHGEDEDWGGHPPLSPCKLIAPSPGALSFCICSLGIFFF